LRGHMKYRNANRISTFEKESSISRTMTYEEKVILVQGKPFPDASAF